jgi:putative serine protease PepD
MGNDANERTNAMPGRPGNTLLLAVALALAGIGAGGGATAYAVLSSGGTKTIVRQVTVRDSQPAASTSALSVNEIYRRTSKGVVQITTTATRSSSFPFGQSEEQQAQGSGFVYDDKGDIVTNQHVVDGAQTVTVKFWNGTTRTARVVGTDASTDLAVIKVDAPASLLSPLSLGDSSKLAVGDGVVAIGSPFGLAESVTTGIVSALHRQITSPNNFAIDDSIQTDAAINHGNSGGPLLNAAGEVIGVTSQIESDSGGNDGVGFAIPSSTVSSVVTQLLATGKVEHAFLGVAVETGRTGATITRVVDGSPAAKAGLRRGDVITAVDGTKIASADRLRGLVEAKRPGDNLSVRYSRAATSHTVRLKLATRPS